jgi:integrase
MPKYNNARKDDLMDEPELRAMFQKLRDEDPDNINFIVGTYDVVLHGKHITQRFKIKVDMTMAMISFLWLFGRRITEILMLDRADIIVPYDDPETGTGIRVMFHALKRKNIGAKRPKFVPYTESTKTYIDYILLYLKTLPFKECVPCNIGYARTDPTNCERCGKPCTDPRVFPGRSWSKTKTRKYFSKKLKQEIVKEYPNYLTNRLSEELAWKITKYLNPNLYNHFYRHCVTSRISRVTNGDAFAMKRWNDWTSTKPAENYVEGEKMGRDISSKMYGESSVAGRKCENCGAMVRKGDRFCPRCGAEIPLGLEEVTT